MNASTSVLPSHAICFLNNNNKFSTFSTLCNLRLSNFPRKEITDGASCFTCRPRHSPVWSIRCEGNRRGRPRRDTSSGGTDKGSSFQSSNDESPNSSNQEEIIALFRRIQSSIAKDGGSTNTRKQRSSKLNERKAAESVLDVLRQSRKQMIENKVPPKRRGVPKTRRETEGISPTPELSITRPPSNFVKKSPIPRPSTLEEIVEVTSEESDAAIVENGPESHGIEEMKVSELKELAKSRGIKGYSKLKKGELIELLRG